MYREAQTLSEEVLKVLPGDDAAQANARAARNSLQFRSKGLDQAFPEVSCPFSSSDSFSECPRFYSPCPIATPRDHISTPRALISTPRALISTPRDPISTPRAHISTPRARILQEICDQNLRELILDNNILEVNDWRVTEGFVRAETSLILLLPEPQSLHTAVALLCVLPSDHYVNVASVHVPICMHTRFM